MIGVVPTREQNWAILQAHLRWQQEQAAAGVDGPVPPERRGKRSDYNLHVPVLEASGEALDDLEERINRVKAVTP